MRWFSILLCLLGSEVLSAQPTLQFQLTPAADNEIASSIRFVWQGGSANMEFRHKLDAPGDWMGGIGYAAGKWSAWGDATAATFDDFILEGQYAFTVEARRRGESSVQRISREFRIHFVMPRIEDEALTIDWNRVRAAGTRAGGYRILAEQYQRSYQVWMRRFELEARVLKLTSSKEEFVQQSSELIVDKAQDSLLEWADKGIAATAGKILLPETLYEIVKQAGLDAILVYRNIRTNRAAFAAISSYVAWHGYEALARRAADSPAADPAAEAVLPAPVSNSARPDGGGIDLIFCIDTTGSMGDEIDAVKQAASGLIDRIFTLRSSVRIALVAYRDYGSEYVTKDYPFTTSKEEMRRNLMSLTVGEGGDPPEAVYEALLDAIHANGLGAWRDGVKKIIVLMGDAPPHEKRFTLDDVAKAAEEADPAHIFPIVVAGANEETRTAFSEIARRTGGVMGTTATAEALPDEIVRIAEVGSTMADARILTGVVNRVMGDNLEILLDRPAQILTDTPVIILSRTTPGLVVASGAILLGEGREYVVELRGGSGADRVVPNSLVQVIVR